MEQFEKIYLYQRIVKAKLFIDKNFADNLNLNEISNQAYFSKYHFIRVFKSVYGNTPNSYLITVRIANAKILLGKGLSVLETSTFVGFESPTSFAGSFKKIVGQAPSVYQKEQQKKRSEIKKNPFLYIPNCFAETHGWIK